MIESQENRCSAPFQEKHSKKLTEIPATHYGIIDNYGRKNENFRPGSKWCHACKRKFYKKTEGESGMVRRKRSKVNIGNSLVSLHLHFIKSVTKSTIDKKLEEFQKALYRHQVTTPDIKIYDTDSMKQFVNKNSPGLFQDLLTCVTGGKSLSENRRKLQEQRVVAAIHVTAYDYLSQKTSALQKDSGLHASNCGMSLRGLSSGQVLGYSTTPRTIQQLKANLSVQHTSFICQQFHRVNEASPLGLQCFIVLMLDDFHNIHSLHTPSQLVRTNVIHMASCLADVHPSVHAVPRPAFPLHRQVTINVNGEQRTCAGGIDINDVLQTITNSLRNMNKQFWDQLPSYMQSLDPGRLQTALHELRVYSDPTTQDIETLETCMLVDEFQQDLKSMEHYKMALERVLNKCPQLNLYSKKFVVPLPADWPGWYYPKKLIASGWNPNISIIPEQGPFHVCLNAYEDVLLNFKFFFDKLFSYVFGGTLASKPKPYQTSLCVTAALLGWQLIRQKVLEKFGKCKQHEFVTILHLLEHVLPLVFYQYNIFRSGDLKLYEKVMAQIAIIFICWKRRHYDKSTLSFLSDCAYQCKHLPEYWSKKASVLKLITEKNVEVWHSVLRRNTEKFDDAKSIEDTAKSIASSGFLNDFIQSFVPQYHRGHAEPNLWLIAGRQQNSYLNCLGMSQETVRNHTRSNAPLQIMEDQRESHSIISQRLTQ
ncbi:unnamed protein product [Porites lobata]|uniref:Transposase n=1 Tax=Porites lobata TaxID=104759 RepID=A0ABN8NPQ1_9CNID|nr:unnamed protein product [Porites lobata]